MLTERQEQLLNFIIREYINTSEPVGSLALKKICDLDVSAATIRNDCQVLAEEGYIMQPHTSAGRVPTQKAYKYVALRIQEQEEKELEEFIVRQVAYAHQQMERQMQMMKEIMDTLDGGDMFEVFKTLDKWHKKTFDNW